MQAKKVTVDFINTRKKNICRERRTSIVTPTGESSHVCMVMHYAVLEAIHAVYEIWQS